MDPANGHLKRCQPGPVAGVAQAELARRAFEDRGNVDDAGSEKANGVSLGRLAEGDLLVPVEKVVTEHDQLQMRSVRCGCLTMNIQIG